MSASTVDGYNTTTQFKSSGDPMNECPPAQALIDAGLPFCFDEFETTGSGPSATQTAVGFSGQNLPTSQAPTAQLSTSNGSLGQTITLNDTPGACPATIGGLGAGAANLFSATNNCWYARAGDSTPVSVTVGGQPVTVTPNPTQTQVTNVSVTSGSEVTTVVPPNAYPTNLEGDLVTDSAGDIPPGTTVTGQGNGTTGDFATVELTLSADAIGPSPSDTLTFTNNADVSEADYSVDNVSTTTSLDAASSTITLVHESASNTVETCSGAGAPAAACTAASAGTSATPYNLVGDSVSGTGVPVGTEVTGSAPTPGDSSSTTLTLSNSTLAADNNLNETLTFYQAILNPPQLNANFTIPDNTPLNTPEPVEVCEATTPNNGNDWEFGVQWLSAQGSLQNIAGDSPTQTEICASAGTITATLDPTSTTTTPTSPSIELGASDTDNAVVSGDPDENPGAQPSGAVSFTVCGPTATAVSSDPCTATDYPVGNPVSLTQGADNSTATSASFTPTSTGWWCFDDSYPGDSNYSGSSDDSTDECFDVTPAGSSTSSTPTSSGISLGDSNSDGATVTGSVNGVDPTGTVNFYACAENVDPCVPSGLPFDTESLNGTSNPATVTSADLTPDSTGTWCFAAVYSGDGNYSGSSDQSSDECYSVGLVGSSTTSMPVAGNIELGSSNSDGATVTGSVNGVDPTGTVDFYACAENVDPCVPSGLPFDTETLNGTSNPATVASADFIPDSTGTWCFAAVYSGDGNYNGSSDASSDECYTVGSAPSSTVSSPSSSTAALDGPNTDSVMVTGEDAAENAPNPTGTVSFYACGENVDPCTPSGIPFDVETLSGASNPGHGHLVGVHQ